jgi:hypothetical protein
MIPRSTHQKRHPELVSGSISSLIASARAARWMLERESPEVKQFQHDGVCAGTAKP